MGILSPIPTYIINEVFAHFQINKNLGIIFPIPTYIINIFFLHFKYIKDIHILSMDFCTYPN